MRNEFENIEIIEKYLRDEFSAEDKKAFEEKLKTNAKLQKELDVQRDVVKGIERIGVKQSIQKAEWRYSKRRSGFFLLLVIIIITAVGLGVNYLTKETTQTYQESNILIEEDSNEVSEAIEDLPVSDSLFVEEESNEEIADVISLPKKKYQYFIINQSKDTTIIGIEGTKISFKANSFKSESKTIKIRLKEYYKMSDIAFSNLTTETIDNKLLETGGMIYIDAMSNNRKVELKNDAKFEIGFPSDNKKEGMKLFDGIEKNNNVKWTESIVANNNESEIVEERIDEDLFTVVETMPAFKGGQEKLFQYLNENLEYPETARNNGISGTVFVNFTVNSEGDIKDVRVLRGIHPLLDTEAVRVVQSMPKWNPGIQKGKKVAVSYNLPIKFTLRGFAPWNGQYSEETKRFNDSLREVRKSDVEQSLFNDEGQSLKTKSNQENNVISGVNNYVFAASNLGWINCDRFSANNNTKTTLLILTEDANTNVRLIFHSIKGVMSGYNEDKYSRFNRIPVKEEVTIFAIKFIDKQPYVALKEFIVSKSVVKLEFEKLTKENLLKYTEIIDNI
jgi:TonB family protein